MTIRTVVVKTKPGEEGERRKGQEDRKKTQGGAEKRG
jgi:hypothetical protein